MQTVILTIVFLASPAGVQQSSSMEMRDVATCESVAETWRRWPGGLLKVMSATCRPSGAAVSTADGAKNANIARN
jgi:hypothetical protein